LLPVGVGAWPCSTSYDLDDVLAGGHGDLDAVMMLRVQAERMNAAYFPSVREYSRRYGLDARRLALLPDHAIVMHPGPMNRGLEISADAADSTRSTIVEQVANGVAVRMAVLYVLLAGAPEGERTGGLAAGDQAGSTAAADEAGGPPTDDQVRGLAAAASAGATA
jgi:aspartate carbamoyltransferase catalytic subunit